MAKAMLIMGEMPKCCGECICYDAFPRLKYKREKREVSREDILIKRPTWCPLREIKEGEWIFKYEGTYNSRRAYCSVCGKRSGIGGIKENQMKPYCPNCGAKMKVDEIFGGGE